ncbi:MAG TPA: hypothetical protein VK817_06080 [Trebonia sp.]|nr:hypothetical protein [Trebonia sp.]
MPDQVTEPVRYRRTTARPAGTGSSWPADDSAPRLVGSCAPRPAGGIRTPASSGPATPANHA